MSHSTSIDLKILAQDPDFKDLTVEQAIRLLGEREKQNIENGRARVVDELKNRLVEKGTAIKSSR